jgi:hypothetical protein
MLTDWLRPLSDLVFVSTLELEFRMACYDSKDRPLLASFDTLPRFIGVCTTLIDKK